MLPTNHTSKHFTLFTILQIVFVLHSGCLGSPKPQESRGQGEKGSPAQTEKENLIETENLALIIAISHYAQTGEYPHVTAATKSWADISSQNDIPLIRSALIKQGFAEKNITVIENKQATKKDILSALDNLEKQAKTGTRVYIHFSGHGQQVYDTDGDEIDEFDEALVPYDAPMKYDKALYHGEYHIRDEELGGKLEKIRTKLGPDGHLLAVLDACHSGTATRGITSARGSDIKIMPPGFETTRSEENSSQPDHGFHDVVADQSLKAPMAVISGSGPDELNYETFDESANKVGSLSYAFSRAMSTTEQDISYERFFDRIKMDMSSYAPRQNPQFEGDGALAVFGGKLLAPVRFHKVKQWKSEKQLSIDAGILSGISKGAKVVFYKSENDTAGQKILAKGTVAAIEFSESFLTLDQPLEKIAALEASAFVASPGFGDIEVRVKINADNAEIKDRVISVLKQNALASIVTDNPEILIEISQTGKKVNLNMTTLNDYPFFEEQIDEDMLNEIILQNIKAYAQTKLFRKLDMNNSNLNVQLELVPIIAEESTWGGLEEKEKVDIKSKLNSNGAVEFKVGDHFKLKVVNKGNAAAYFCILDLQPDNKTNVLVPSGNRIASEYKINPGQTIEIPDIYGIYEPTGLEVFKLIATTEPMNLKGIVSGNYSQTRGGTDPLETFLAETFNPTQLTRGAAPQQSAPVSSGNVNTLVFQISKK